VPPSRPGWLKDALVPGMDSALEFQRLQVLRSLHLLAIDELPQVEAFCGRVQERFGVEMVLVTVVDRERQIVKARVGTNFEGSPRPDAFCDHLIRSDEVLVVPDARADRRFAANPFVSGEPFIRFYAGAPLIYMRDIRLGGLCLLDTRPRDFSQDERAALADMAEEVMILLIEHELDRFSDALKR
jgi:GAF domain-containing protein